MVFQTILKRAQNIFNYYYDSLNTQRLCSYTSNLIKMTFLSSPNSPIKSNESLLSQLNDVFSALDDRLSNSECPQLVSNCRQLHSEAKSVLQYAKQYDYNDQIEANGYWTFVRLIIIYGKVILNTYKKGKVNDTYTPVAEVLLTGLKLCEKFHSHNVNFSEVIEEEDGSDDNKYNNCLYSGKPSEMVELLDVFKTLEPQLDVVYGNYCSYWLCPSMRRSLEALSILMAMFSCGSSSWLSTKSIWLSSKNLWDRSFRAHSIAHIAQNASVDFVKSFWGLTELSIIKNALPSLAIRSQPKIIKEVFIPRQNQWIISDNKAEVINTRQSATSTQTLNDTSSSLISKIRCKLLQHHFDEMHCTDSLVLHIHGGGFVSQSPESHEIYLRDWACKLSGTPILSIDYSLSPEWKYPIALQEALDCYLWLISGDETVKNTLGFNPKRIVVCGDSAGGNLSAALCLVLNDMRKIWNNDSELKEKSNFIVPTGIVCFYTPFMLMTLPSPSRLMTAVDTLLPLGVLLTCLEAYAPSKKIHKKHKRNSIIKVENDIYNKNSSFSKLSSISPLSNVSEGELDHDSNQLFDYASLHFMKPLDYDSEIVSMDDEISNISDDITDEIGDDFVHITYDDVPPDEDLIFKLPDERPYNIQRKCCKTLRNIKDRIIGSSPEINYLNPWYRDIPSILVEKLIQLNKNTSNAYLSPYLMPEFDFDDIPIYIIGLTYDACLDDSIEMAKKWKGPVVLDILDELPHGFLNFVVLSEEAKRGSDLCVKRIKQALKS